MGPRALTLIRPFLRKGHLPVFTGEGFAAIQMNAL
jgi:hypothetical protein